MHEAKLIALCLLTSVCGGCIADPQLEAAGGDIVNGQPTADYPAVGLLRFAASKNGRSRGWVCTATLIDANILVTAAHCFGVPEEIGEPDVMAIPTFGRPLIATGRTAAGNGAVSRKFFTADGRVFTFSGADCDDESCATGDPGGGDEGDGDDQGVDDWNAGGDDSGGDDGGDDVFNSECSCDLSYECEPDDLDPEYDCWCDPDCGW